MLPQQARLEPNFPNPFNRGTLIRFSLAVAQEVELVIYDLAGQRVAVLAQGLKPEGASTVAWDGRNHRGIDVGTGVYLCRLRVGNQTKAQKLLLLR